MSEVAAVAACTYCANWTGGGFCSNCKRQLPPSPAPVFLHWHCTQCGKRLAQGTPRPSKCAKCPARYTHCVRCTQPFKGRARGGFVPHCDKCVREIDRDRTKWKQHVAGYTDGYEGHPRADTASAYVQAYRLGANRRKAGRPPVRFTVCAHPVGRDAALAALAAETA